MNDLDDGDDWNVDDDDVDTLPCPACGESMFEDSPRCPACGEYVTTTDSSPRRPLWVMATAIVCLVLAAWWALVG